MKALRIPLFVLLFLFAACLCSDIRMARQCAVWEDCLDSAEAAVKEYDFAAAETALAALEDSWAQRMTCLHITIEHDEIDRVQELLGVCRVSVTEKDALSFLTNARRLRTQLAHLREMEQLSIHNIL